MSGEFKVRETYMRASAIGCLWKRSKIIVKIDEYAFGIERNRTVGLWSCARKSLFFL
jgi:hypothetical protein